MDFYAMYFTVPGSDHSIIVVHSGRSLDNTLTERKGRMYVSFYAI